MTAVIANKITLASVLEAANNIKGVVQETPLVYMENYSEKYQAKIYFKREDQQVVRSYKIRGAYNKIKNLSPAQKQQGVVCASAGNHAQGVALACASLGVKGVVFMPITTPNQKVAQVQRFGGDAIRIELIGDTYDDSYAAAKHYEKVQGGVFAHPFNDAEVIAGQGTVGLEIIQQLKQPADYVFLPVGGGGLASGVGTVFHYQSPATKVIGVEPKGAASLTNSLEKGRNTSLDTIEKFVDGAAVRYMGDQNFEYCKDYLASVTTIASGHICSTLLQLYNQNAMVVEPAGVLSIAALEHHKEAIKGKTVVCIVSGGNNDITRMEEMKERALLYEGLKHYFLVTFPQRAGALKEFVMHVLGDTDDIAHFEYTKKNSRSKCSAVVGIELQKATDFEALLSKMKARGFYGEYLNENKELFRFLV